MDTAYDTRIPRSHRRLLIVLALGAVVLAGSLFQVRRPSPFATGSGVRRRLGRREHHVRRHAAQGRGEVSASRSASAARRSPRTTAAARPPRRRSTAAPGSSSRQRDRRERQPPASRRQADVAGRVAQVGERHRRGAARIAAQDRQPPPGFVAVDARSDPCGRWQRRQPPAQRDERAIERQHVGVRRGARVDVDSQRSLQRRNVSSACGSAHAPMSAPSSSRCRYSAWRPLRTASTSAGSPWLMK